MRGADRNSSLMDSPGLEEMADYFNVRAERYDALHLRSDICWGLEVRERAADLVPVSARDVLDLGAGTGIEIGRLLDRIPAARIRCVDLSSGMLRVLKRKFPGENVLAEVADFRTLDLPSNAHDAVLSVMALHHLRPAEKLRLYRQVWRTLRPGGMFVNSDYIVDDFEQERALRRRARDQRAGRSPELVFHLDVPMCEASERRLLARAGFVDVDKAFENRKAKIVVARKSV